MHPKMCWVRIGLKKGPDGSYSLPGQHDSCFDSDWCREIVLGCVHKTKTAVQESGDVFKNGTTLLLVFIIMMRRRN